MKRPALALFVALLALVPVAASSAVPVFNVPGAQFALDPSGSAVLPRATSLSYQPASAFAYPHAASVFHPLVVWLRFPNPSERPSYIVASPAVGRAVLYYRARGNAGFSTVAFGMRQPFARRALPRVRPTIEVPSDAAPVQPLYLRLALDDETHLVSAVTLVDERGLAKGDAEQQKLASTALFFIGVFVSLAAANLFVFLFVREWSYVIYSGMMLGNALFAASYLHESAWAWFWPWLSLPEEATMACIVVLEAVFLLAFARSFMKTSQVIPRTDAVITTACAAAIAGGLILGFLAPSSAIVGPITGREAFLLLVILFTVLVFALGIAALRTGSRSARFFVASNGVVSLSAAILAGTNFTHHALDATGGFIALMAGQAVEGWLLFGALAYRLRQTIGAHMEEQQQRLLAQAEALAQARALLETRQQATTDALTGIANRRAFDEMLEREWDRCARRHSPLSLLLLDVDLFKKYNDAYGHVAGDECLQRVAQAIAACATRPTDICARYGGEEFAVILGDTDIDGASTIAHEIVRRVRSLGIAHRDSPHGVVTVSVGCAAVVPAPGSTPDLVRRADAALYRAKEQGRDRVERAETVALPRGY